MGLGAQTLENAAARRKTDLPVLDFQIEIVISGARNWVTQFHRSERTFMERTSRELAVHVGAQIEGNPELRVTGCATPESAGPGDLIYIDSPKHLKLAASSKSTCVLIGLDVPSGELAGKTLLRAKNPKLAYARAIGWMFPQPPIVQGVHPTAVVAKTAKISKNVAIGPYAVIEDDVEVGESSQIGAHSYLGRGSRVGANCTLYPRVTLYAGARLGARVIVHSGAVIGSDGFGLVRGEDGYEKFPQLGTIEIADDVEIGANTTIDRGALGATRIDRGVKLDNLVHIGHNCEIGEHTTISAQTGLAGSSIIGKNSIIGGQVGIGGHCRLEDGAILGSKSGVLPGKILRGGVPMWGIPAQPLEDYKKINAWYNRLPELAERLRKLEESAIPK
jgi:UDP-3-O-[3-hydroxymyristoyl] glucosamine N-acyltransferase